MKRFSRLVLTPLVRLIYRPKVVGRRNMPKHGGVLLASNHLAFIDSVAITLVARRPVTFMVKDTYFTRRGIRGRLMRAFFASIGAVPVERGSTTSAEAALQGGLNVLRAGEPFSIYPEGTRSRDGRLYRGKTGVAWLAMTAGVPVVPVGIIGTDLLQPAGGSKMQRGPRVTIRFGEPIDMAAYGSARSGRDRRAATDAVMAAIQRLTGQEVADVYNDPPPLTAIDRATRRMRGRRERL